MNVFFLYDSSFWIVENPTSMLKILCEKKKKSCVAEMNYDIRKTLHCEAVTQLNLNKDPLQVSWHQSVNLRNTSPSAQEILR